MSLAGSITSLQNPRVKNVVRLRHRRHRDRLQQTVVEGAREAMRALLSGLVPLEAYICPPYLDPSRDQELLERLHQLARGGQTQLFEVPPDVYDKMAYRGGSGGVLLVIPYLAAALDALEPGVRPLFVVVDGAEKPGNLGAILRTADAAGVTALLLTGSGQQGTDIHNPNVVRASLGALFTVPVVSTSRQDAIRWLRHHGIAIIATTPDSPQLYTDLVYDRPVAVVMGSEAQGLGPEWLSAVDHRVRIPMSGVVDSLNLSVATAVILYEAVRQRRVAESGSVSFPIGA